MSTNTISFIGAALAAAALQPSVAEVLRGKDSESTGKWWAYCPDHLYGRWIELGRVWGWRLVPITAEVATRG